MLGILLWRAKFGGFLAAIDPFRTEVINGTPDRHFLHRKHVLWAIIDLCATLRSGSARSWERRKKQIKNKKGTQKRYISRICRGAPVQPIVMLFGTARDLADVIKILYRSVQGFRTQQGSMFGPPNRKPQWPLPLCGALTCTHVMLFGLWCVQN